MVLGSGNPFAPSVGSFQVPVTPPDIDPDEGELLTVCFNAAWLPFVLGALQQLTLQATWSGDDDTVLLAQSRAQMLLAMVGSPDGGCNDTVCFTGMRYDTETDQVQQTFDGGSTFVDQSAADPRHNTAFEFPPNTAGDPKCQGAANLTRFISDLIAQVIAVVDTAGEAEGILALLLALFVELGPFGILIDLVLGLAAVLFGAGSLALADAFTNTVFDQLTCIFFCHMEADGSVTAADLTAILSDINTQIGGLVYTVLSAMFFLMGEVGMSNAAATGSAPADCSGCECCPEGTDWCQTLFSQPVNADGGFTTDNGDNSWSGNFGHFFNNAGSPPPDNYGWATSQLNRSAGIEHLTEMNVFRVLPSGTYTDIQFDWQCTFGVFTTDIRQCVLSIDGTDIINVSADGSGHAHWTGSITGTPTLRFLMVCSYTSDSSFSNGGGFVTNCVVAGSGTKPTF